jgi:hypothetical protein
MSEFVRKPVDIALMDSLYWAQVVRLGWAGEHKTISEEWPV